jgi:uncharacterized repeat protein (TIGR01451 family)
MAGKTRLVAKLFVSATVLASSGSGAYYYKTHGLTLPSALSAKTAAAPSDLDAVASAWGGPSSLHPVDASLSSPIARSAQPEPAKNDKKSDAKSDDRYALPAEAPKDAAKITAPDVEKEHGKDTGNSESETPVVVSIDKPAAEKRTEATAAEPTLATAEVAKSNKEVVAADTEHSSDSAEKPVIAKPVVTQIARGQEPKDDAAAKFNSANSDLNSAFDTTVGDGKNLAEPKPLVTPNQPTNISATSTRAKQAFNNNVQTGAPNDRYGDPVSAGRDGQGLSSNGANVNPFGSQPAVTQGSPAKPGMIEPLRSSADDGNGRLNALSQSTSGGLRPMGDMSTASSINRDIPSRAPLGQSSPRAGSASAYDRTLSSNNQLNRANNDITPIPMGDGTGKPGEKALEGPQQPTLVIQKFAPSEIQVGKTAKFVVQIRNAGGQSADGVTIRDEIPQGTKLISTSPSATTEGSHIIWQIGKLSPGEDRTVEMQLMPTTEGDIGSVATVSYNAQVSVKTRCTMPQLAIRMTAANEVMVGSQQHVKIELRNPGSGDATGVILFENVPPNVKHVAGPALEFEIGTLHPNETRELDLVLTAEKAGKVVNTLTAKADGNLQVQQQVEFEVIAPGLTVGLDGPERRYLERPATYEVSVQNPGTAPAHDVQIVTKLPKGMKFVRANNMGEYDAATHAVYWSLAELPKGEKGTVELVAMPTEAGPQTLQVDGHAQQGLVDHKQRDIMVEGLAALMFEVKDTEDPIEVNGETGYEIRVVNQGTKAATNVSVTVEIPPGLKVISAEGESGHKLQDGRLIFEPLQQLAPKADSVFKIRAQGLQPGDQRIVVEVNTDDLQHPIRREESTRVFGDQ